MFPGEVLIASEQCQELALILDGYPVPVQLNQLAQWIAPQWWPKSVVDELRELLPRRCATVPL
jgi:hypothetical protein